MINLQLQYHFAQQVDLSTRTVHGKKSTHAQANICAHPNTYVHMHRPILIYTHSDTYIPLSTHICSHECLYTYMSIHICTHLYLYTNISAPICILTHILRHTNIYIYLYITYISIHMPILLYPYMHTYLHINANIYTCPHTHVHTCHSHKHTCTQKQTIISGTKTQHLLEQGILGHFLVTKTEGVTYVVPEILQYVFSAWWSGSPPG